MKHVHLVIPDLFLPASLAKNVCTGLHLPVLGKLLARGKIRPLQTNSLEACLCEVFAVPYPAIAPLSLLADGIKPGPGYYLRADPVHLRLNRDEMILQTNVSPTKLEAEQLCAYLNDYFVEFGMRFLAAHPQRWYLQLEEDPGLETHSVYQVEGRNSRFYLPKGDAALKWHGVLNEMQMALYGHPLYQAQEARGILPINSVWLWGGGRATSLAKPFVRVHGESELAMTFAKAAGIPFSPSAVEQADSGEILYVWEGLSAALRRGDFHAWRESVVRFEQDGLRPVLELLVQGKIDRIVLDAIQEEGSRRFELTRAMLWKVWLSTRSLNSYALV